MVETVDEDGTVTQHRTKDDVKRAIHNEIGPRFSRAGSAPICNVPLFKLLGYNDDTFSGRHFGHYAAAAHSDLLSEAHTRHLALITKTGTAPKRWSKGLLVMLEQIAALIT